MFHFCAVAIEHTTTPNQIPAEYGQPKLQHKLVCFAFSISKPTVNSSSFNGRDSEIGTRIFESRNANELEQLEHPDFLNGDGR